MIISGAYGRDYTSKKALLADWLAGRDFLMRDLGPHGGRYVNKTDLEAMARAKSPMREPIRARYKRDTMVCVIVAKFSADGQVAGWLVK